MMEVFTSAATGVAPVIISNGFFDTTGANAAVAGFELKTFTQPGLRDSFDIRIVDNENPFKGNIDIAAAESFLEAHSDRVALILVTITNNFAAAQPVSMGNIKAAASLAQRFGVPMFFDACRFAENARFIQEFEPGYAQHSIQETVREMFSHVDGFTISLKKDGMANMGGALAIRDDCVFMRRFSGPVGETSIGVRLKEKQILCYGNDSYGGMSGRDLMAAAVGLYETTKEVFLRNRIGQVRLFARKLVDVGVPMLLPPGGHAVYLNMAEFFGDCGRRPEEFASVGFTVELLRKYGIRATEAGLFAWEWDKKTTEEERDAIPDLVRFAVPRNAMTDAHICYAVAAIAQLYRKRHIIPGAEIIRGKELRIRHFQCGFALVPVKNMQCTFSEKAQQQLGDLLSCLRYSVGAESALHQALELSMSGWGASSIPPKPAGRLSDVGLDHSPIEYSLAIEHSTGKSELRFLVEAQSKVRNDGKDGFRQAALDLTYDIKAQYPDTVSLERLKAIDHLFVGGKGHESFTAWHSSCVSARKTVPGWKVYLNPQVDGECRAEEIIMAALTKLGFSGAFKMLKGIMRPQDHFMYFALDLNSGDESRIKAYIKHPGTTAVEIADRVTSLCPHMSRDDIVRFCSTMCGGSPGPYTSKPVLTCFAFTSAHPNPEATVHVPVSEYVQDDDEAQRGVEAYHGDNLVLLKQYRSCVEALRSRDLKAGRGLHSWVSLKSTRKRGLVTTFYLSSEMFGPLPPGRAANGCSETKPLGQPGDS